MEEDFIDHRFLRANVLKAQLIYICPKSTIEAVEGVKCIKSFKKY